MSHESGVPVSALLEKRAEPLSLTLELLAGGRGLDRRITSHHVQKTGLALAGLDEYLKPGRVLILGASEIRYLEQLDADARAHAIGQALRHDFPCMLMTGGLEAPGELHAEAERVGVPLLRTSLVTPQAIEKLSGLLEEVLAAESVFHGVRPGPVNDASAWL